MSGLSELVNKIENLKTHIMQNYVNQMVLISNTDIVGQINRRVEDTGLDKDGGLFSPYTEFTKKYKKAKGQTNVSVKNFSDTRQMWLGFGVKGQTNTEVVIGGRTQDSQFKIDENSDREGKLIIDPSKSELDFMEKSLTQWIEKLISSSL